jgi:uncharacterized protein
MDNSSILIFDEHQVLHKIVHYLPAQAPLKDFVHHNTLHAFQNLPFDEAMEKASEIFGFKVSLSLHKFRSLYKEGLINQDVIKSIAKKHFPSEEVDFILYKLLEENISVDLNPRIGSFRSYWKTFYKIDLDSLVHPLLFRLLCSFLDQGISIWPFPLNNLSLLDALRKMEKNTCSSFFRTKQAKILLQDASLEIGDLLKLLVGKESLYEHYLFDQQFSHQGWSGMVATIESNPASLLDQRKVLLKNLIFIELLFELDALNFQFGKNWRPLGELENLEVVDLFGPVRKEEWRKISQVWQEAFEWTFYNQALCGIQKSEYMKSEISEKSFQALFCIDDRECSLRRYIEQEDRKCETYGTPGFFGVEFYFQPQDGKFYSKSCPPPVNPKYIIREENAKKKFESDFHFSKQTHNFVLGWFITHTIGFWSAFLLFINIFRPRMTPATASSLKHMDKNSDLTIQYQGEVNPEGLQVGFSVEEMVTRVENVLKSIGIVKDFAPLMYVVGHGASSLNNPYYSAYDCGACCGRAGSVNARTFSFMANHPEVRKELFNRGIELNGDTTFVGALHDTTRDEIVFYDEDKLSSHFFNLHNENVQIFERSLHLNAKERSRRFESIDTELTPKEIHEKVKIRSVSLFEPRPELNHATNALCIVGRRDLTKGLFLDRRSFLNSYNHEYDQDGKYLSNILNAAAPVCGGINLEYFFSKVDDQKLGAGSKLPHNVMGLFGIANGIDGDLRPGLPTQMTEVHDPIRLMIIVEHFPEVVLMSIKRNAATYEWFKNDWIYLVSVEPNDKKMYLFQNEEFVPYFPPELTMPTVKDPMTLIESSQENFPVYLIENN